MIKGDLYKEFKSLEAVTNKTINQLTDHYYKCYKAIPSHDFATQFEYNHFEAMCNNVIVDFVRDYALFDDDSAKLLKKYDARRDDTGRYLI